LFKEILLKEKEEWEQEDIEKALTAIKKNKYFNKNISASPREIIFDFKDFKGADRLKNKITDYVLGNCDINAIRVKRTQDGATMHFETSGEIPDCLKNSIKKIFKINIDQHLI